MSDASEVERQSRREARTTAFRRHPWLFVWRKIVRHRGLSERYEVPSDPNEIYRRLVNLPVSLWTYGFDHPTVRHLGPMAQDFGAAFGLAWSDRSINLIDANGVMTIAMQVADRKIAELETRIVALEAQLAHTASPPLPQ